MTLSTIVVVLPAPECHEADRHFTLVAAIERDTLMRFCLLSVSAPICSFQRPRYGS